MIKRILLIEDESFIAELYQMQLKKAGISVDIALMGNDGIVKLRAGQYDLLLLDIMLPDINGIEVLKKIKADQTIAAIPVILLTNLAQDDIIKQGFTLGAQGYLIKAQFTPDQLLQEISTILATPQAAQANTPNGK